MYKRQPFYYQNTFQRRSLQYLKEQQLASEARVTAVNQHMQPAAVRQTLGVDTHTDQSHRKAAQETAPLQLRKKTALVFRTSGTEWQRH